MERKNKKDIAILMGKQIVNSKERQREREREKERE